MSNKNIYLYTTIVYFIFISNCFASSELPYKEGELLVRFAPKINGAQHSTAERNQILSSLNSGEVKRSYKRVSGLTLVKLPEGQKVADALSKFEGKGEFLYVEPNYKIKLCSTTPSDPNFVQQWAMHNTGQNGGTPDADIDGPEAWDIIHDACDIIVAVLDTGIDRTHPDLVANMWVNPGEIPGNGINDDGNYDSEGHPLIDDVYGWDFADNDADPSDYYPHGTHVAGIIGARGNNGIGVAGICWNVKIMNLKIFPAYSNNGFIADAISAIDYAIDKGAKVLNNSWSSGYYSQPLKDAIDDANDAGVLFIAAAGNADEDEYGNPIDNDGSYPSPTYPASYDCNNIISVMATNHNDQPTYYSNYGYTRVDLAAPGGEQFYSGDPGGILSTVPGNAYEFYQGTSMAAPHVAGACALVWAAHPNLTHLQVKDAIMQSVDHLTSLSGLCVAGGRLNLFNAVHAVTGSPIYLTQTDDANAGGVKSGDYIDDKFLTYLT